MGASRDGWTGSGTVVDGQDQQRSPATTPSGRLPAPAAASSAAGGSDVPAPDKAIRVGQMARQLLDEIREIPLDESGRARLHAAHERSVTELASALSPELTDELCTLMAPLDDDSTPSARELKIVQAQLVGWLEGLFQGIRISMLAEQLDAEQQLADLQSVRNDGETSRRGTYL